MLEFYTSDICIQSWGRSSYAKALIEVRADVELKDHIVVAMPKHVGEGFYTCTVRVEYEWKPPRCACCNIFGHVQDECLTNKDSNVVENMKKPSQSHRGIPVGPKVGFKPSKQVYKQVSKKNNMSASGNKKKDAKLTIKVSNSNPFYVLNSVENDVDLSTNGGTLNLASKNANSSGSSFWIVDSSEGKPLTRVDSSNDHDSEDEVASVDNDMTNFMASNSLLEQWKESYENGDYDYDPYDNDMYEGPDIPDKIQDICDNLDIKVRDSGCLITIGELLSVLGLRRVRVRGVKEKTHDSANNAKKDTVGVSSPAVDEPVVAARNIKDMNGNGVDVVVPVESIRAISERFANTTYGFLLGKRVAYTVVANYVRNIWGKYGLVKSILNSSTGIFSLQFSSIDGLDVVLENGPWFIRNNLLILKKWNLDVNLLKEDAVNVSVWVKLHGVHVTTFSEDGLSVIATKLCTPLMLEFYKSGICIQSWGRSSYAKALIEVRADVELKDNIVVAMPKHDECPINKDSNVVENMKKPSQSHRGIPVGHKVGFKPAKQVYRQVSKKNNMIISGNKKKNAELTIEVSNSDPFDVLNSVKNDVDLSTNGRTSNLASKKGQFWWILGKPLTRVDSSNDHASKDEVASVDNDMTNFLASSSLLEQ
nr:hypothetical protein [Tanacetum cinerariifolium]